MAGGAERYAHTLPVFPRHRDHAVGGRAVLPAVDAMDILADAVAGRFKDRDVTRIRNAEFTRFLTLEPGQTSVQAFIDIEERPDNSLSASLITRMTSPSSGISRVIRHASLVFPETAPNPAPSAPRPALDKTPEFLVPAKRIYEELVPFGPAYRTIKDSLKLFPDRAQAYLLAGPDDPAEASGRRLGSGFPLDGTFHAACVWSQRFAGIVAFPVGFEERIVLSPTRPGETYQGMAFPTGEQAGTLFFDLWITDAGGQPVEAVLGAAMRDVSGGRLKPPDWIREYIA